MISFAAAIGFWIAVMLFVIAFFLDEESEHQQLLYGVGFVGAVVCAFVMALTRFAEVYRGGVDLEF